MGKTYFVFSHLYHRILPRYGFSFSINKYLIIMNSKTEKKKGNLGQSRVQIQVEEAANRSPNYYNSLLTRKHKPRNYQLTLLFQRENKRREKERWNSIEKKGKNLTHRKLRQTGLANSGRSSLGSVCKDERRPIWFQYVLFSIWILFFSMQNLGLKF